MIDPHSSDKFGTRAEKVKPDLFDAFRVQLWYLVLFPLSR